ncbi:Hypothetical predicted protein [Paramuricea clavata]|nr:Hypothetical predicted protein [Paramuricea clavata]
MPMDACCNSLMLNSSQCGTNLRLLGCLDKEHWECLMNQRHGLEQLVVAEKSRPMEKR